MLSFNGNKIITTGGGGMLLADRADLIDRARYLATQAREPVPHYEHREIGYNDRLSNLLAAVGRGQLRTLDERVAWRRAINARYRQGLADVDGIAFMPEASYGRSNCWLTCALLDETKLRADRESLREHLEKRDIESRPVWKPMHLQPVFAGCRARGGSVAEDLFRRGLCLPSGTGMSDDEVNEVIAHVRDWAFARTLGVGP